MDPKEAQFEADAALMADVLRAQGWDTYQAYVEAVAKELIEDLIQTGGTPAELNFKRGYIKGLRRAAQLPQEVIRNRARARN